MSAAGACWGLFGGAVDSDRVPRMGGMGEAVGTVQGSDAVLDAGGVDAVGEQLVAGAHRPGDVHVLLGTTLIVWAVIPEHREVPGLQTIPHLGVPGVNLIGGPSNAGGLFLNWVSSLLGRGRAIFNPRARARVGAVPARRALAARRPDAPGRAARVSTSRTAPPARAAPPTRRRGSSCGGCSSSAARSTARRRIVATGGGVRDAEWVQAMADATQPAGRRGRGSRGRRAGRGVARPHGGRARDVDERRGRAGRARRIRSSPTRCGPTPWRSATRRSGSWRSH